MALRRRRPDVPKPSTAEPAARAHSPAPPSPTSSRSSRARILLFAVPLLAAWYFVFHSALGGPRLAPSHYAVCSPRNRTQVVTMDETTDGGAHLRVQCIVVDDGRVVDWGTAADVRAKWGDLETKGRGQGLKGGLRIFWLKHDETVLPGLYILLLQVPSAANA